MQRCTQKLARNNRCSSWLGKRNCSKSILVKDVVDSDDPCSNANVAEVIANAELGCQHITILEHHLKELSSTPLDEEALRRYPFLANPPAKKSAPYYKNYSTSARLKSLSTSDPLAGKDWDGTFASTQVDYLADDGKALADAINKDPVVVKKMRDVLKAFSDADDQAKTEIESEIAKMAA
jgi:transaldolase